MTTTMNRAELARAAFYGQNEALMRHLNELDSYTMDGHTHPSNGMSLLRAEVEADQRHEQAAKDMGGVWREPRIGPVEICPACGAAATPQIGPGGERLVSCVACGRIAQAGTATCVCGRPVFIVWNDQPFCKARWRTGKCASEIAGLEPDPTPPAARVNWSEGPAAPLHPVEALKLALERGVFGLETLAVLRASYEAAEAERAATCSWGQEAESEPHAPPLLARGPFAAVRG